MRRPCIILSCCFLLAGSGAIALEPKSAAYSVQAHLVGEITEISLSSGRIIVQSDAGNSVVVITQESTSFRRLAAGESSLEKAERINASDLRVGDRVLVPGASSSGQATATQIIVMARPVAGDSRAAEREDWRKRGLSGRVLAVDLNRKELSVDVRAREGSQIVSVAASDSTQIRRFAPDSIRVSDAVKSSFEDIKVGQQLRARGDRSADGTHLAAEEIVTGLINRIVGTVTGVDADRGEVTIKPENGELRTVNILKRSSLRRMPRTVFDELTREADQRSQQREQSTTSGATSPPQPVRNRRSGRSVQQVFESLPTIAVADLKKGDAVVVTATVEPATKRETAVALIAGERDMLRWLQRVQRQATPTGNMSPGLPGTVMGGNTGTNDDDEP